MSDQIICLLDGSLVCLFDIANNRAENSLFVLFDVSNTVDKFAYF